MIRFVSKHNVKTKNPITVKPVLLGKMCKKVLEKSMLFMLVVLFYIFSISVDINRFSFDHLLVLCEKLCNQLLSDSLYFFCFISICVCSFPFSCCNEFFRLNHEYL